MDKLDAWFPGCSTGSRTTSSTHRGVPVLMGVLLVVLNYLLVIIPGVQLGFVETTNLCCIWGSSWD